MRSTHVGAAAGIVFAVMIAIVFVDLTIVLGLYAALAARARRLIDRPGAQRVANRLAGATMAGAAIAVVAR